MQTDTSTPSSTEWTIARGVGRRLADGWNVEDAIREASDILRITPRAALQACRIVATFLDDPCLEGLS